MLTIRADTEWVGGRPGTTVRAGKHHVMMDEPQSTGGDDLGPNPMQFLLAGIGGCLIGMGRLVARERNLSISRIRCRVEGDVNPDGMTAADPAVRPGCQEIRLILEVDSEESNETLRDWLETVERRCPVRDTVANATPVTVRLRS